MDDNNIETLVLRFRDLAVSDTIAEHQKIIKDTAKKYCWWGWWNKPQEQLPCDVFAKLNSVAQQSEFKVFLFDSGNKKLYTAKCTEIKFSTNLLPITLSKEEIDKIPTYYQSQAYLAWFKFTSIAEETSFILDKYSYVNVESFFKEQKNSFKMFNNKKICSLEELYYQQRTIWFIRKSNSGDGTQEINLMSDRKASPQNYDDLFTQLNSDSILWLSDLHFSEDHHAYGHSKTDDDKLSTMLKAKLEKNQISPSAIVISGDITYKAQTDEFGMAEQFIRDIDSFYSIDPYNLVICPGNHDFAFETGDGITVTTETASQNYRDFYKNIFNCDPSKYCSSIRKFLTKSLIPVEIISLNSITLQQIYVKSDGGIENKFTGLGYVGRDQIKEVEDHLKSTKDSNAIRLMVIHHHIVPVLYSEEPEINKTYSLILDAGRVNQFIFDNNISIVLHGHAHKQFYRRIGIEPNSSESFDCNVIGIGSAGVNPDELSEGDLNMFGVLTFKRGEISIQKYSVNDNTKDKICEHIIKFQ